MPRGTDAPMPGCQVDGCRDLVDNCGYCCKHYNRWRAHGGPLRGGPSRAPAGAGTTDQYGYRWISVSGVKVMEHRHVMAQQMGRQLAPGENVHHRNGDRADNRRENLELWTTSQPSGQRVSDRLESALALVEQYGTQEQLRAIAQAGGPIMTGLVQPEYQV